MNNNHTPYIMKKILFLFVLAVTSLCLQAQNIPGIRINARGNLVLVYLNGQQVNMPATSCFIANLSTGNYLVEIYEAYDNNSRRHSVDNKRCLYRKRIHYRRNDLKEINLRRTDHNYPWNENDAWNDSWNDSWSDSWSDSWDDSRNDSWNDSWNDCDGYRPNGHHRLQVMSPEIFQHFFQTVKNESFDKNKFKVIEQATLTSRFTSTQCAALVNLFSFDKEKIRVMKIMYPVIVDKDYFFSVIDKLSFLSSKEEIQEYLKQYHNQR